MRTANALARIAWLEQRLQVGTTPKWRDPLLDRPADWSLLTEAQRFRLVELDQKVQELGIEQLSTEEVLEGANLVVLLHGGDPSDPYGNRAIAAASPEWNWEVQV